MKKILITVIVTFALTLLWNHYSQQETILEKNNVTTEEKKSAIHWTCSMHPTVSRRKAGNCPICGMDLIKEISKHSDQENANFVMGKEISITRWTCSMHPTVFKKKAGKCPICGMDLIKEISEHGDQENIKSDYKYISQQTLYFSNTETYTIKRDSSFKKMIKVYGKLGINKENIKIQTAHFSGRVEKSFIKYDGQRIKKGQKIMRIYAPTLITLQKEWQISKYQSKNLKSVLSKIKNLKLSTDQLSGKNGYFNIYAEYSGNVKKNHL